MKEIDSCPYLLGQHFLLPEVGLGAVALAVELQSGSRSVFVYRCTKSSEESLFLQIFTLPSTFRLRHSQEIREVLSLSYHRSLNREGRWGTTDDFATSFLHFSLFSTALWDLANSGSVHSLMSSSNLFIYPPCLLPPFTVPCKMVLARPDEVLYTTRKLLTWYVTH